MSKRTIVFIVKITACDLFIYVGGESDEWVDDALAEPTNKDMAVIDLLDVLGDRVKEEEIVEGMEAEHAKKLVDREPERLRVSFDAAKTAGYRRYIMFLHYPPTSILEDDSHFTAMAEEYGAEQVIYAYSHGESRFHDSILGEKNGIRYSLVSGDYLKWKPMKVSE